MVAMAMAPASFVIFLLSFMSVVSTRRHSTSAEDLLVPLAQKQAPLSLPESNSSLADLKPMWGHSGTVLLRFATALKPGELVRETVRKTKEVVVQESNKIFGLHPWTMAFLASFVGSMLTVVGLNFQKMGAHSPGQHLRIGDIVLSSTWFVGFLLVAVADFPLSMFVYSFAPISLIAPLSGITVVLNLVAAPYMLSERVHTWPDLPATALITVGIVLTTYAGAHAEPDYDTGMLWARFTDPAFQLVMLATGLLVGGSVYAMRQQALAPLDGAQPKRMVKVHEMLLPALAAGGAGVFSNIHLKAAGILLASGSVRPTLPWFVLTILPAAVQVNYLNRGMQLYPQAVFIPIYTACLMLLTTLGGAVFYQDYSYMQWQSLMVFFSGAVAVFAGIGLFALRSDAKEVR